MLLIITRQRKLRRRPRRKHNNFRATRTEWKHFVSTKIIFLDVDGVLNGGNLPFFSKELPDIHPYLATKLEQIVQATSAKLVISSSWRCRLTIAEWNELLTRRGVTAEVIDVTPKYWEIKSAREDEIKEWLAANLVENFLVLDDIPMVELKDNAVETDFRTGMTDLDVARAIEILNK